MKQSSLRKLFVRGIVGMAECAFVMIAITIIFFHTIVPHYHNTSPASEAYFLAGQVEDDTQNVSLLELFAKTITTDIGIDHLNNITPRSEHDSLSTLEWISLLSIVYISSILLANLFSAHVLTSKKLALVPEHDALSPLREYILRALPDRAPPRVA